MILPDVNVLVYAHREDAVNLKVAGSGLTQWLTQNKYETPEIQPVAHRFVVQCYVRLHRRAAAGYHRPGRLRTGRQQSNVDDGPAAIARRASARHHHRHGQRLAR